MIDPPWTKTSSSSRASVCSTGTSRSTRRRCASAGGAAALVARRGDSVAAVVERREDGAILLTRQFRYPTLEHGPGFLLELPAGSVEGDEEPVDALRRELIEELGYEAGPLEPIATFYVTPGGSSERVFLYATQIGDDDRVGDGGGLASEGEAIEIVAVSVDELLAMVADGTIEDAKTIIGAWWLERRRDGS